MKNTGGVLTYFLVMAMATGLVSADDARGKTTLPLANNRDAYEPAVAFGSDVFLVAWKSGHLADGDLRKGLNYIGDIVACRVDRTGKVLDAEPLSICSAADLQERPRIAFGDGLFLVVWHDIRNEKDWDIYAARVTAEGKVLDPDGILVSGGAHNQAVPDVTWDGNNFQVVWQDFRGGNRYEVYGARVSADGKVLEPDGRLFVTEKLPYSRINPVVASLGGGKSLLFWLGGGRKPGGRNGVVAGAHLVQDGRVSDGPTLENTDPRSTPGGMTGHVPFPVCAVAGPHDFFVSWPTSAVYGRGDAPNDAHAALFTREGRLEKKIIVSREKVRNQSQNSRIRHPSAAWDGSAFVVAWHQISEQGQDGAVKWPVEAVFCTRVVGDGTASDRQHIAGTTATPATKPAVASNGAGTTLIVYEQHPEQAEIPIRIDVRMVTRKQKQRSKGVEQ